MVERNDTVKLAFDIWEKLSGLERVAATRMQNGDISGALAVLTSNEPISPEFRVVLAGYMDGRNPDYSLDLVLRHGHGAKETSLSRYQEVAAARMDAPTRKVMWRFSISKSLVEKIRRKYRPIIDEQDQRSIHRGAITMPAPCADPSDEPAFVISNTQSGIDNG